MVAEISGAGLGHSVVSLAGASSVQRPIGLTYMEDVGSQSSEVTQDKSTSSSTQVAGVYARLHAHKDEINSAASVVRKVSDTVEKVNKILDNMESNLGEIVKMYPPYPVDSPQRITLLNKIDGLRKQIDNLTFPPPESMNAMDHLLGVGASAAAAEGDLPAATADKLTAAKERMWDIPTLDPVKASDEDVAKVLEKTKAAIVSLEGLKSSIWQDVVSFVNSGESPEMPGDAARVREQIASLGGRGISSNSLQLERVAESK